jgi:hypothetical protein
VKLSSASHRIFAVQRIRSISLSPSNWRALDSRDADLGGTNPIPLDLPASGGTQKLIIALGKDGKAYLLDRNKLGGIGGALVAQAVAQASILGAPAAYPSPDGVAVAFAGTGAQCPSRTSGTGITVLNIQAGSPPNMMTAWCGTVRGRGSPIATTTDGRANPIVWTLGAEGDNRLHGCRGDRGELLIYDANRSAHWSLTLPNADCYTGTPFRRRG